MSTEEGWTIVTCRRRPQHLSTSPYSPPRQTTALSPLSLTYAQVVQAKPKPPQAPTNAHSTQVSPPRQPNPASHLSYVQSPHSPTRLRYPPSPHFKEWWGRCFRCTKKGHVVAECQQPRTNPASVQQLTQSSLKPSDAGTSHSRTTPPMPKRPRPEPSFEEFLGQPAPHQ